MKNKKNLGKIIALALALGSCTCNVTEAYASYEDDSNNIVNVDNDMNNGQVVGGYAHNGNSNNNVVNIMAGANNIWFVMAGEVYEPNIAGEYTSNSNKVVVNTAGNVRNIIGGSIVNTGIAYKTSVNDNKVIVNNGNIDDIYSAHTRKDFSKVTEDSYIQALNNNVTLNNGKVRSISAIYIEPKYIDSMAGYGCINNKAPLNISGNSVIINGGEAEHVKLIYDHKIVESSLTVKDNSINIYGGVVGNIYGCNFLLDDQHTMQVENNTVNWYGGDINGDIFGYAYKVASDKHSPNYSGFSDFPDDSVPLKGSSFNFFASSNNSNKKISGSLFGFENYHFYLDNTVTANTTLINCKGVNLRNSNVGVAVLGSSPLKAGDSVTLLSSTNANGGIMTSPNLTNDTSHMRAENISTVYDFTLRNEDNKKLIATVAGAGTNPKSENLVEARQAEAFMTYDKVDIVDKAYQASKHTSKPTTFIEYGYSDITTRDDTNLRGSNVLWGIASTIGGEKDQANTLTRGLFFEYGDSTFASHDIYDTGSIYGYGKGEKTGLGVLVRKVMFDRHYYDAYLRAGTLNTDYNAFADGIGNIKYSNRDVYISGNLGYGQFIQLTPNLQMDAYVKYFYNRIPGHSTTAYTNGVDGMPISFDVFENHRFRVGSKFTWDYMESNNYKLYADIALEQELANDQSGSFNGHRISKSNGANTTGIIELCYENKFGFNNAFKFVAKAQGYVGDRRGLGASANLSFSF